MWYIGYREEIALAPGNAGAVKIMEALL